MTKTVLITGASRGIGRATARCFGAAGWRVAVHYHNSEEQALALCEELGNEAMALRADVSDPVQVQNMVDAVVQRWGRLDVLICNAGIDQPICVTQDLTDALWHQLFSVNVDGVFYAVRAALPHMIRAQSGRIITVSSMWGQVGGACESAYSATKGAVIAFTKALAQEVGPSHITANCIAPGCIDTDMMAHIDPETRACLAEETPMGRMGQPEEVAAAALFLAGEQAGFITGQVLGLNGGFVI